MEQILEQLQILFFGDPSLGLSYGLAPLAIAGIVQAAGSVVTGIMGNASARRKQREADAKAGRLQSKLYDLERNRQAIINPYDQVEDLSTMITNPYDNLGVATQAAEMQAEQADISLANTLDAIRSTGASAGGATALAQAALQSKKGVAASIEQQEAQNEKLKAQGEIQEMQARMAEAQRLQQAGVQGSIFEFQAREQRETAQLDRISAELAGAQAQAAQAQADRTGILTSAIGGVTAGIGNIAAGMPSPKAPPTSNFQFTDPTAGKDYSI